MKSLPSPTRQVHYRRIADGIRVQILDGTWTPGTQLPATDKLAGTWKASYGTVHTALQTLVKEGWIERLDGAGTFVADFKNRFTRAGIYYATDIFSKEDALFMRALHTSLLKELGRLNKETQVFVDSRPENQQGEILPALTEAIFQRRIQCLIAPLTNSSDTPALSRLRLPLAFTLNSVSPNQVVFNRKSLLFDAVKCLKEQGCRSVGLLTHIPSAEGEDDSLAGFYNFFRQAVSFHGLELREEWIRRPDASVSDLERHGYHEFKNLWKLRDRPDGLIVYPDVVVHGTITAVLELGVGVVPPHMKFVFHRNAPFHPLCPFGAAWAVSDVDRVAAEMVGLVQKQFNGEKTSPVLVDHTFELSASET